jgi:hypothetical protein
MWNAPRPARAHDTHDPIPEPLSGTFRSIVRHGPCLLDHAAELRDAVGELLEDEVSVELAEDTLEQAVRVESREHD